MNKFQFILLSMFVGFNIVGFIFLYCARNARVRAKDLAKTIPTYVMRDVRVVVRKRLHEARLSADGSRLFAHIFFVLSVFLPVFIYILKTFCS